MDSRSLSHEPELETPNAPVREVEVSKPLAPEAPAPQVNPAADLKPVMAPKADASSLSAFKGASPLPEQAPTLQMGQRLQEAMQDPALREALKAKLDGGQIRAASMKEALGQAFTTNDFTTLKDSQASAALSMIQTELPVKQPAEPVASTKAPALSPSEKVEARLTETAAKVGADPRIVETLRGSAALEAAVAVPFSRGPVEQAPVGLKAALQYTQVSADKAGNFSPEFTAGKFQEALTQPNYGELKKLATEQGLEFGKKAEGPAPAAGAATPRPKPADTEPIKEGGVYDRAIKEWFAKGAPDAPAPIAAKLEAGEALNMGDARALAEAKVLDFDAVKVARQAPERAAKAMATEQQSEIVKNYLVLSDPSKPGLPKPQFMSLNTAARNEVRSLVGKIEAGAVDFAITAALWKEMDEKILNPKPAESHA